MAGLGSVAGIRVGHWNDSDARTGCTVVLLPSGTVASGEVRGGAPATREFALLEPGKTVERVDAVVLTGGSAFGLAACDGVMRWCEERGIGVPTPAGPVPIVVGMALFDLMVGSAAVRPGSEEGYSACVAAMDGEAAVESGAVGAGTGATIAKWRGEPRPGGLGSAAAQDGDVVVAALVAVNAIGEPRVAGEVLPRVPHGGWVAESGSATTIGVIVTNAAVGKVGCHRLAESGHDGLARALDPAHCAGDGDALVAASTGEVSSELEPVRALAAWVVEQAVLAGAGSVG